MIKITCKWFGICPLRRFEEKEEISDKWKKEYCLSENNWLNCKRYQFEEKGKYHPDNMMPNGEIDKKLE